MSRKGEPFVSPISKRLGRSLSVAAAAALALPGAVFAGDDSGKAGKDQDGKHQVSAAGEMFATIKDGDTLVVIDDGKDDGKQREHRIKAKKGGSLDERFVGIDVRPTGPMAGGLYGITEDGGIYLIDPKNGQAELKSTSSVPLEGKSFGVDFNPVVDRLRVISDADQNLRINVDTGAALVDGTIEYAAGDRNAGTADPMATGAGYTYAPFVMGTPTPAQAASTALFDIETKRDVLATQAPPNNGTLNTIGSLNRNVRLATGFDIAGRTSFQGYGLFKLGDPDHFVLRRVSLRNGGIASRGLKLEGSYDGLAVLDGYRG